MPRPLRHLGRVDSLVQPGGDAGTTQVVGAPGQGCVEPVLAQRRPPGLAPGLGVGSGGRLGLGIPLTAAVRPRRPTSGATSRTGSRPRGSSGAIHSPGSSFRVNVGSFTSDQSRFTASSGRGAAKCIPTKKGRSSGPLRFSEAAASSSFRASAGENGTAGTHDAAAEWPNANHGIATGPAHLVVVDMDTPKPGQTPPPKWVLAGVTDGAYVLVALAECERAGQTSPTGIFTIRPGRVTPVLHAPGRPPLSNTSGARAG
ncbi:bifunctional DNA primase/polymerase [Nocardiopsis sp. Huas11]|uniref:bifunctional DNA primase/polymerase n=1 Tax=Nocardiopsis sp. Huas11 TaxID=2183912 RepID=UPI003518236D